MNFSSFINSRNNISSQLEELRRKIDNTKKQYSDKVSQRKKEITKLINKIDSSFLSISIEKSLMLLPNNALGSKEFASRLNQKSSLYDNVQLNKIIRFLTFIENSEEQYNSFYHSIQKKYLKDPDCKSSA